MDIYSAEEYEADLFSDLINKVGHKFRLENRTVDLINRSAYVVLVDEETEEEILSLYGYKPTKLYDAELEEVFKGLSDLKFEKNKYGDEVLTEAWERWNRGDEKKDIISFFDRAHSKGIDYLLKINKEN